ncbi:MAG: trypsin-like peptidase domain-containing protein [Chloroflexota bacterium]|nr:trypsin-like peptidase domain-containing protein [Chloroflexota bacterium]
MRRVIPLLVVIVMLLSACGGDTPPPPVPTNTPSPTKEAAEPDEKATPKSGSSGENLTDEELAEKMRPSVVRILAQFSESAISPEGLGAGSGVVYDLENGYIATNAHVVEGASIVKVALAGSDRTRSARVVGRSQCDDLAVIKVDNTSGMEEAVLDDSDTMKVAAPVMALGYPESFDLGNDLTVTTGNISKLHTQRDKLEDVIQMTAFVTHGNSGGPLVNHKGEVIGINTRIFYTSSGEREPGINFAISMSHAKPIIEQLQEGKNRHYIGLNLYPNLFADYFGTNEGMAVVGVASGSPASQVGIEPADLLLKLEGTSVADEVDVCNILRSHADGDQLSVQLYRKTTDEVLEGELTMGEEK